jgi:hypothetical protein
MYGLKKHGTALWLNISQSVVTIINESGAWQGLYNNKSVNVEDLRRLMEQKNQADRGE